MKPIQLMASIFFNIPILFAFPFTKQYGDLCDWRDQPDICDQSRFLGCSFTTSTCSCWDLRSLYSPKVHRCVGKAGEECFERLCTENSYCLEDLNPPLCVCLKGYHRSENGTCVKYSKLGEPCQIFPYRQACDPESGLRCGMKFSCECEPGQVYDTEKELCLAKAGEKCSKNLNNCIVNSECNEKMWAFDYQTGETKLTGYRCACTRPGLKITNNGLCAVSYGGNCNKTSECIFDENLVCLNGICQCHPLSQIYDKKSRQCFNLVGTRCHLPDDDDDEGKNKNLKNRTNISTTAKNKKTGSIAAFDESPCGTERADCIPNAQCVSTSQGINLCKCANGSSETVMKTCFLDYGQSCQPQPNPTSRSLLQKQEIHGKEMKCNVFEGLICHSDLGKCLCADPSLVYESSSSSCVSTLGNPCGNVKLDMLDLAEDFKQMIFINCDKNSTCLEKSINGKVRSVCVPTKGNGGGGSSLSQMMFNNANVITDTE